MTCPFCPIEKKTEWFGESPDGIVVCEDLDPKQYKYRILVVGSGKYWHRDYEHFKQNEKRRFTRMGERVARRHIREGRAFRVADVDMGIEKDKMKHPEHWHCQFCMMG